MASSPAPSMAEALARQLANSARNLRAALDEADRQAEAACWMEVLRGELDQRFASVTPEDLHAERLQYADTAAQLMVYGALLDRCPGGLPNGMPGEGGAMAGASLAGRLLSPRGMPGEVRRQVGALERLLDATDIAAVLEDVCRTYCPVRPESHFYERFLAHYAHGERRGRGVYYTPAPIVRYVVRSVERLLRQVWRIPGVLDQVCSPVDGRVPLLVDPACGSGTFLLAVIQEAGERFRRSPAGAGATPAAWPPMLCGYEVQPVAGLVARHLLECEWQRLCLCLSGSDPPPPWRDSRWPIRWANALDRRRIEQPATNGSARPPVLPIILGNPPYSNFGRRNRMPWIRELLADYKIDLAEKKLNLDDDFIKFIRWSQFQVDEAGAGIVALVTSNTYLTGLTHRRMRQSLRESFDQLYVLDLHGDRKRDMRNATGGTDENVFGVQQGVAISVLVKTGRLAPLRRVWHADLSGSRREKLRQLDRSDAVSLCRRELPREVPDSASFFAPSSPRTADSYDRFPRLDQVFRLYVSGVQTKRDALLVDRCRGRLATRIRALLTEINAGESAAEAPLEASPNFDDGPRETPRATGGGDRPMAYDSRCLRPYQVAPFDMRWLYYEPRLLGRARWSLARHLLVPNLALVFMRQSTNAGEYDHFLATTELVSDRVFYSGHGAPFFAPLFLRDGSGTVPNLQPAFLEQLSRLWSLPFQPRGHGELHVAFGARDVFDYLYAVFHAPAFRARYGQRLAVDFPRLPLTGDRERVRELCAAGHRLVSLHTSLPAAETSGALDSPAWSETGGYRVAPGYPKFVPDDGGKKAGAAGRLSINPGTWLHPVALADWQFQLGGYRVLDRWLQSRRRTRLSVAQRRYLAQLLHVLSGTRKEVARLEALLSPWPWD